MKPSLLIVVAVIAVFCGAIIRVAVGRSPNWFFIFLPLPFFLPFAAHLSWEGTDMYGWIALGLITMGSLADHFGDQLAEDATADKKARLSFVANCGFVATIVGVIVGFVDQVKSGNEADAAQKEIKELQVENLELSKANTAKQVEITNMLTGGDSIFYLRFVNDNSMDPLPMFEVRGEYDVPQVILNYYRVPTKKNLEGVLDVDKYVEDRIVRLPAFGPVSRGGTQYLRTFEFPEEGFADYKIFIINGRKQQVQLVRIGRMEDKSYRFAYRVYELLEQSNGRLKVRLIPELSYTDTELSPTKSNIVPALDFPENFPKLDFVK